MNKFAAVTYEVTRITDMLEQVRLFLGIDAYVDLDQHLSVIGRGVTTIRLNLAWAKRRRHPDPDDDIPPNEIRLDLTDAALLHQMLGQALVRAYELNDPDITARTGDDATNVIRLATTPHQDHQKQEDQAARAVEAEEDQQQ